MLASSLVVALVGCVTDEPHARSRRRPPAVETSGQAETSTDPSPLQLLPRHRPVDLPTLGEPEPEPEPDDSELFDEVVLPEFELEIDPLGIDALRADPYTYVEAALIYGGTRYEPVAVRLKGQNSFQPIDEKPSLKIDLNRYVDLELLGLDKLTLDNMDNDESMLHERLAYRMYRELGVPASRCTHAWVRLNGRDLGLYAHVESIGKEMIGGWLDDEGSMYEIADVDFRPEYTPYDFELEFGVPAVATLQGAIDALDQDDPDLALQDLESHMSVDAFVEYFAASIVIGQYDAYPYSDPGDDTHVYKDPATGVLVWLPHGVDETFHRADVDPFVGTRGILGRVGEVCLASTACRDQLEDQVALALDVMEAVDLVGYAEDVIAQIAPLVLADTARPYDDDAVEDEQDVVLDFLLDRRQDVEDAMD